MDQMNTIVAPPKWLVQDQSAAKRTMVDSSTFFRMSASMVRPGMKRLQERRACAMARKTAAFEVFVAEENARTAGNAMVGIST